MNLRIESFTPKLGSALSTGTCLPSPNETANTSDLVWCFPVFFFWCFLGVELRDGWASQEIGGVEKIYLFGKWASQTKNLKAEIQPGK